MTVTVPFIPASKCPGCRQAKSKTPAWENRHVRLPVLPGFDRHAIGVVIHHVWHRTHHVGVLLQFLFRAQRHLVTHVAGVLDNEADRLVFLHSDRRRLEAHGVEHRDGYRSRSVLRVGRFADG
ncbi:hypothetical protein OKW34_002158 [Paraburkholderia youngii]